MDSDWRQRLQLLIEERGLKVTRLSVQAGMDRSTLGKILAGSDPTIDNFLAICRQLGITPSQLLEDGESFAPSIPLAGYVLSGEDWVPVETTSKEAVDFEITPAEALVVEVRGDSLSPVYRSGDRLFCQRHYGPFLDNLIGRDCVIQTKDGRHFIKILKRGSKPNRMTLKSFNPLVDDIEDVAVAWAAPVLWVKRS